MELLDLYDDNGNKLNKTVERGKQYKEGRIMLSIVFIKNSNDEYLIQKTSKEKGLENASTGGHVNAGESSLTCIIRELEEELGLQITKEDLHFLGLEPRTKAPVIFAVYTLIKDINIEDLKLQEEEVESVSWLTKGEILKLIKEKKFKESHGDIFKKYISKNN